MTVQLVDEHVQPLNTTEGMGLPPLSPALSLESFLTMVHMMRQTLSLEQIGTLYGVNRSAVHQWISGATTPSLTVRMLAAHLARRPADLADGLPKLDD